MIRRLSLTARLAGLYTLTSAIVLLGLGSLILVAVEHHFLELDRATLQDKLALIKEVGSTSSSMADFQARLASVLSSHKDLSARVQGDTGLLYTTPGLQLPAAWLQAQTSDDAQGLFTMRPAMSSADSRALALSAASASSSMGKAEPTPACSSTSICRARGHSMRAARR